jgi:hypothetical protein
MDFDGYATIIVSDEGQWREPADAVEETRARGDYRVRGLGLAMVRDTVDGFAVDHNNSGGTTARLRRRLRRPAPLLAEAPGATGRHSGGHAQDKLAITPDGTDSLVVRGPLHIGAVAALESRLAMETRGGTRSLTLDLSGLTPPRQRRRPAAPAGPPHRRAPQRGTRPGREPRLDRRPRPPTWSPSPTTRPRPDPPTTPSGPDPRPVAPQTGPAVLHQAGSNRRPPAASDLGSRNRSAVDKLPARNRPR